MKTCARQVRDWHVVSSCFDVFDAGFFTPSISSDSSNNEDMNERRAEEWIHLQLKVGTNVPSVLSVVPPPACAPIESARRKETGPPLSDAIIKRMEDNRAAALRRKQAVHGHMSGTVSVVPLPPACAPIESALKEMRLTGSGLGDCGFML